MTDKAHLQTDRIIARVERELQQLFLRQYREIRGRIADLVQKMNFTRNMDTNELLAEANKYNRLGTLTDDVVDTIQQTTMGAIVLLNKNLREIYDLNYSYIAELLEERLHIALPNAKASEIREAVNENPYKQVAIDRNKSKVFIRNQLKPRLLAAIIGGGAASAIFVAIKESFNQTLNETAKITRTEATRLENTARQDVMSVTAFKYNVVVAKKWNTREDERVRDSHARAEGQTVGHDKDFVVGGEDLAYPADPRGDASNVINCRCYITPEIIREP